MSESLKKEETEKDKKKKNKPAFLADENKPALMTHKPEKSPIVPQSAEVQEYQSRMHAEAAKRSIDKYFDDDDDDEEDEKKKEKKQSKQPEPVAEETRVKPEETAEKPEEQSAEQPEEEKTEEQQPEPASEAEDSPATEEKPETAAEEKSEEVPTETAPLAAAEQEQVETPSEKISDESTETAQARPGSTDGQPKIENSEQPGQSAAEIKESAQEEDPAVDEFKQAAEASGEPEAAETAVIEKYELDDIEKEFEQMLNDDPELAALVQSKAENLEEEPNEQELDKLGEEVLGELDSKPEETKPQQSSGAESEYSTPATGESDTQASSPVPAIPVPGAPPVPPISGGGEGGGGGPAGEDNTELVGAPAIAPEIGSSLAEKRRSRRRALSAGLLGGLIGYYFGKKAGKRQQEAKMKPDQEKLEKENDDLKFQISEGEKRIRRLRHAKEEQAKLAAKETVEAPAAIPAEQPAPVSSENVNIPSSNPEVTSPAPETETKSPLQTPELAAAQAAVMAGVAGAETATETSEKPLEITKKPVDSIAPQPESGVSEPASATPEVPKDAAETSAPEANNTDAAAEAASMTSPEVPILGQEESEKTESPQPPVSENLEAAMAGIASMNAASPEFSKSEQNQTTKAENTLPETEEPPVGSEQPSEQTGETRIEPVSPQPPEQASTPSSVAETIDPFGLKDKKSEQAPQTSIENFYQTAGAGKYEKPEDPHESTEANTIAAPEKAVPAKSKAEILEEAKDMKVSGEGIVELFNANKIDEEGLRKIVEAVHNDAAPELVLAQEKHKLERQRAESPEIMNEGGGSAGASGGAAAAASSAAGAASDTPLQELPKTEESSEEANPGDESEQKPYSPYAPKDYSKLNKIIAGSAIAGLLALLLI